MRTKAFLCSFIILPVLALTIFSCQSKEYRERVASLKSTVENNIGKKLILPENLNRYSPFSDSKGD